MTFIKRKFTLFCIALFGLFLCSASLIDDDPFDTILKKLTEYVKNNPEEKVYLHLDKPYYAVGDNIWFKAYVINGRTTEPSTLSNILYVELINDQDSIKKQLKLPLESGISWGDFKLPDSLSEGNYRIRAYTQWMRNAGTDFFFDKTVKIGNAWSNNVITNAGYQFTQVNNTEKVNSTIQFKDKEGNPFVASDVTYQVELDARNISRGKAITDQNGEISIAFVNTMPNLYRSGKITATITLPGKQKVIKIIPIKATSAAVDVQFFPEGGNFIAGLPCKVGIKAVNSSGLGEDVSGEIIDDSEMKIIDFETTYLGMGTLFLNPVAGKTYSARVKFKDGSERLIKLPKVLESGYALNVTNTDTAKMNVRILISADLLNKGELRLVGQYNGNVYFVSKVPSAKQVASMSIVKSSMPSGILQLTLFSPANLPVAERLVFINNVNDKINLNVSNLQENYSKRSPVNLSFTATNKAKPVEGSFSVSVTNATVIKPDPESESNILTSLLLTSDLVGYVEKPNHYFLNNDVKTSAVLDQLLLIQGWRKINWQKILADQMPAIVYQPEKSIKISGTITNGNKPVVKGKVSLLAALPQGIFNIDTLTDANGKFSFDGMAFPDSTKFIIQARTEKNKKYVEINLDIVPGQIVTKNKNTGDIEVNVNESLLDYIRQSNDYFDELTKKGLLEKSVQIKAVTVVAVKKSPVSDYSSNLNGPGHADVVITAEDLEHVVTLGSYLQSRVVGLYFENGMPYLRKIRNMGGTPPMRVILDGMQLDGDYVNNINVADIESIEVLKSVSYLSIYGTSGGGGLIVITTKRGDSRSNIKRYAPGITTYNPKGYSAIRQFYSPKYDVNTDNSPDLRTTVYWEPHVVSDKEGKASFNFYNTDQAGTYRVVIEGIDAEGNLARKVFTYTVN